ncbi:zinc ribbon domain-containing protein [Methanocella sp. MCL-LM]|uniref:zinc ribbon domain-containing protein n=1 Tax=Methanocella sp. MCL-LM TaxID=3412035 RepID=UPI003C71F0C1
MAEIRCTRCGAPIPFDSGVKFVKCSHCGTQLYIDKSGAGFFYIMPFFIQRSNAEGIFKRWTAGAKMARDLERAAKITDFKQLYFPVYLFRRNIAGKEKVFVEPAKSTTMPGLHALKVPAGDLKIFDESYSTGGIELVKPDIEMTAYLSNLEGNPVEQALVFFPIWALQYEYKGNKFPAVIDGSSGEVYTGQYPTRKAAPYLLIAAASFGIFFLEGLAGFILSLGAGDAAILVWIIVLLVALFTIPFVTAAAYVVVRRF